MQKNEVALDYNAALFIGAHIVCGATSALAISDLTAT